MPATELISTLEDETGFRMELQEIFLGRVDLKWGQYRNPTGRIKTFSPEKPAVVTHFLLANSKQDASGKDSLKEKQFVVYREYPEPYQLYLAPTKDTTRSFFELIVSERMISEIPPQESEFLTKFPSHIARNAPSQGFTADMSAVMHSIIYDMQHCNYIGHLKNMYLEAKATELLLAVIRQLDQQGCTVLTDLKPVDIASIYSIKEYIESNYSSPFSLADLAKRAGINQMKLKTGFKKLFDTTVFGYLSDVRMLEARRLLHDEKLYVKEVSDRIGYKHPHHFTVAFRKKFGYLPSDLKD